MQFQVGSMSRTLPVTSVMSQPDSPHPTLPAQRLGSFQARRVLHNISPKGCAKWLSLQGVIRSQDAISYAAINAGWQFARLACLSQDEQSKAVRSGDGTAPDIQGIASAAAAKAAGAIAGSQFATANPGPITIIPSRDIAAKSRTA